MEVKIKADYVVLQTIQVNKEYEGKAGGILDDFLNYHEGETFVSEDHLIEEFTDFVINNAELPLSSEYDEELSYDRDNFQIKILNLDEILSELSYLIVPEPILTCCQQAPYGSRYCNTCGNKL